MEPQNALAYRREPLPATLRLASDAHLVEQVHAGSERAFEALFDRYQTALLQFCARMLGSLPEAEDAVQLTFMAAYRDLVQAKQPTALRPWLYAIARHRCLNVLRARRERPLAQLPEVAVDHLASEVATRADLQAVLADLATLPRDQRQALVLSELGDVSHEEIAQLLGCQQKKVKALVFQARSSLASSRSARETPCAQIREQLASLHGTAVRRALLRRHLAECPGCRAFRDELRSERRQRRVLLPVMAGLRRTILGPLVGSGSEAGGALVSTGALTVERLAAAALAAIVIPAGGIVVLNEVEQPPAEATQVAPRFGAPAATTGRTLPPYALGALALGGGLRDPRVPTAAVPGTAPSRHGDPGSSPWASDPAQIAPTTASEPEQAAPMSEAARAPDASHETIAAAPAPAPSQPKRPTAPAVPATSAPISRPPASTAPQAAATRPSAAPARPSVAAQPVGASAGSGAAHAAAAGEQAAAAHPSARAQRPTDPPHATAAASEPAATAQPSARAQRPTDPPHATAAARTEAAPLADVRPTPSADRRPRPAEHPQPDDAPANVHAGQPADPAPPDTTRPNPRNERPADPRPAPPAGAPRRDAAGVDARPTRSTRADDHSAAHDAAGVDAQPTRAARTDDRFAPRGETPATTSAQAAEPAGPTAVDQGAPESGGDRHATNDEAGATKPADDARSNEPPTPDTDTSKRPH
jgi:RNA polymerase sigma factor (sigma-70 family)